MIHIDNGHADIDNAVEDHLDSTPMSSQKHCLQSQIPVELTCLHNPKTHLSTHQPFTGYQRSRLTFSIDFTITFTWYIDEPSWRVKYFLPYISRHFWLMSISAGDNGWSFWTSTSLRSTATSHAPLLKVRTVLHHSSARTSSRAPLRTGNRGIPKLRVTF